jgi:hypothetical protein
MGNKPPIFVLVLFMFLSFALPAPADDAGKVPMISGAKEKPCAEEEKGTCLETPKKRFEITSSADIGFVVKDLLLLSKEKGWKMLKITGSRDLRYQSRNTKDFSLMWSVKKARTVKKPGGKDQTLYYIYYWQIYGD